MEQSLIDQTQYTVYFIIFITRNVYLKTRFILPPNFVYFFSELFSAKKLRTYVFAKSALALNLALPR